ncbi:hypothetical protein DFH06DRAFT_105692 [Mycena polygramma]|nr:hypothetical protein DFH06DRAFT_105692 [Mycena polygramma]
MAPVSSTSTSLTTASSTQSTTDSSSSATSTTTTASASTTDASTISTDSSSSITPTTSAPTTSSISISTSFILSSSVVSTSATPSIDGASTKAPKHSSSEVKEGPSSSSASPTSAADVAGSLSPGGDTETLTATQFLSASSKPTLIASGATSNSTPFLQNKGAVSAVFTAVGLLALIALVCVIRRIVRRRHRQQLDREMDEISFVPTALRAIVDDDDAGFHRLPSLDLSRTGSNGAYTGYSGNSVHSESYGAYEQPPMSVTVPQPQYNYGSEQRGYTLHDYGIAEAPAGGPVRSVSAVRRAPPGQIGESEREIVQPPRAHVRQTATFSPTAESGLVHRPSQSAVIQLAPTPSPPARDYLSNYTTPPASAESMEMTPTTDIPLSPPLPNPYGGYEDQQQRVLKVTNE